MKIVRGPHIWAYIAALLLFACSGGGGGGDTSPGITPIPPTVTSTLPASGASDVAVNTVITAAFSKDMDAATINGTTFTLDKGVTGVVTYDAANRVAAFTPSAGLANNTTYTATITTGVRDLAGNSMANNFTWSFTTATSPQVTSTTPPAGGLLVAVNTTITAIFSRPMDSTTVTSSTFTLKDDGGNIVPGSVSCAGTAATFTPSGILSHSTTYTATLTRGVKDPAGNALTNDFIWSFTTIPPPAVISTPQQAAAVFSAFSGAIALMDTQFSAAIALGQNSLPAGFAPGFSGSSGVDVGSIDPTLALIVENMKSFFRSAAIQSTVKKAGAHRSKAMLATVPPTTLTTEACNAEGQVVISGSNTYDEADNPNINSAYDLVFTNCRDSVDFTQLDGTLHIEQFMSTVNDGVAVTVVANGLTQITFADDTFAVATLISALNGTFFSDNRVTAITKTAEGSFTVTTPAQGAAQEKVVTLAYGGLTEHGSLTHNADSSDTLVTSSTGTITLGVAQGGTATLQMTLGINLEDTTQTMNDVAGTRKNRINGTASATWAPDMGQNGCNSGSLTIATDIAAPRTFTSASGLCPVSGTVRINDATVTYGTPIVVTAGNGDAQSYSDCAALSQAGAACLP